MELDVVATATSSDGKGQAAWKQFNFQLGALSSALEHAIPEQMFVTPENPGEAVSALKALQKAASQGQRIYHITQTNMATALPNLRLDPETLSEIRQALNSGKEVITHTDPISVPGWQGAGYVITDMETGAGAWKIGGGLNGGWMIIAMAFVFATAIVLFAISGQWLAMALAAFAYKTFLDRVEKITRSGKSPDQMYAVLNEAAAIAALSLFGSFTLTKLGASDLKLFLGAFLAMFGWAWF